MNQSKLARPNFIGLNSCQLNCPTIARASPCMLFIVNALDLYCSAPARLPSANFFHHGGEGRFASNCQQPPAKKDKFN